MKNQSVPILPKELYQLLFFIQLTEERYTLLALPLVQVLHEFRGAHFAEFPARLQVGRAAQNCQLFSCQTVVSLFAWHFVF
jgi:hypothetical protein